MANHSRTMLAMVTMLTLFLVVKYSNDSIGVSVRSLPLTRSTDSRNRTLRFVSMCSSNFDRRRLGNQLFNWAAVLYVARLTGAQPAMPRHHPYGWIDRWFDVGQVHRVSGLADLCPCAKVTEHRPLAFDRTIANRMQHQPLIDARTLLICGLFQSWRYSAGVGDELRQRLRWKPTILGAVRQFLDETQPPTWKSTSFRRVGVHVRAGDVLTPSKLVYGFTVPGLSYFTQAASFLDAELTSPVQYVVATDNQAWTKRNVALESVFRSRPNVSFVHSVGHGAAFDMALLASCDALILSTGSYGWWAAWLANKTTVYYRSWPRRGSLISSLITRDDYFPPHWVGLGNESDHTRDITTNDKQNNESDKQ